jgi:hypothetical protein
MMWQLEIAKIESCNPGGKMSSFDRPLIASDKRVDEMTVRAVIPQHSICPLTVDVRVAVRPEGC